MDYSQLSDFEINKRVFKELTGANPLGYPHNADGKSVGSGLNGHYSWYDYCNCPADAWPIISANRISIEYDAEERCDIPAEWVTAYGIDDLKVHVVSHQPCDKALRSAMIVFLMMQDAKHA
jgi:hypothetical protein